ncbi:hypothetical protein F4604DRAFT_1745052 [Suillus subluteus]|nr:hypothetical protein F4604DRAFT_1745052 [Suillus subluteus]
MVRYELCVETTVTSLIENKDTHRVIGILVSKAVGQPESYFANLVVFADGSLSNFRPREHAVRAFARGLLRRSDCERPEAAYGRVCRYGYTERRWTGHPF